MPGNKLDKITDGIQAFKLLVGMPEPLVVLKIFDADDAPVGSVWIRSGRTIIAAHVAAGASSGYIAFLELMALKHACFELDDAPEEPPGEPIEIDLQQLVENQSEVIDQIKSRLWPVADDAEPGLPASSIPIAATSGAGALADDAEPGLPADELPANEAVAAPQADGEQQPLVARDTAIKLRSLRAHQSAAPGESDTDSATTEAPLILKLLNLPRRHPIYAGVLLLMLPVVALPAAELQLTHQERTQDIDSTSWQVSQSMDREYSSSLSNSKQLSLRMQDIHSPFIDPVTSRKAAASGVEAAKQRKTPSLGKDSLLCQMPELEWKPKSQREAELTQVQLDDIEQQMQQADRLAAAGHLDQAAAGLEAASIKYPRHAGLRLAAVRALMRISDYARAKKLAIDGIRHAVTEDDYFALLHLLKKIPG